MEDTPATAAKWRPAKACDERDRQEERRGPPAVANRRMKGTAEPRQGRAGRPERNDEALARGRARATAQSVAPACTTPRENEGRSDAQTSGVGERRAVAGAKRGPGERQVAENHWPTNQEKRGKSCGGASREAQPKGGVATCCNNEATETNPGEESPGARAGRTSPGRTAHKSDARWARLHRQTGKYPRMGQIGSGTTEAAGTEEEEEVGGCAPGPLPHVGDPAWCENCDRGASDHRRAEPPREQSQAETEMRSGTRR
ncbi:unnamed protein product [Gadus morhua 'NCC']